MVGGTSFYNCPKLRSTPFLTRDHQSSRSPRSSIIHHPQSSSSSNTLSDQGWGQGISRLLFPASCGARTHAPLLPRPNQRRPPWDPVGGSILLQRIKVDTVMIVNSDGALAWCSGAVHHNHGLGWGWGQREMFSVGCHW